MRPDPEALHLPFDGELSADETRLVAEGWLVDYPLAPWYDA